MCSPACRNFSSGPVSSKARTCHARQQQINNVGVRESKTSRPAQRARHQVSSRVARGPFRILQRASHIRGAASNRLLGIILWVGSVTARFSLYLCFKRIFWKNKKPAQPVRTFFFFFLRQGRGGVVRSARLHLPPTNWRRREHPLILIPGLLCCSSLSAIAGIFSAGWGKTHSFVSFGSST